jgi:transcriptional regulator with AAA-type ATPase domain
MKKTVKQFEKKIHSIVNKEFNKRVGKQKKSSKCFNKRDDKKSNQLVDAITKSVILNKRMLNRDKDVLKKWQESYFQELYSEFKKLVEKYNNGLQVKAETLTNKISDLKIEKRRLQDDVRELEVKKKVLIND